MILVSSLAAAHVRPLPRSSSLSRRHFRSFQSKTNTIQYNTSLLPLSLSSLLEKKEEIMRCTSEISKGESPSDDVDDDERYPICVGHCYEAFHAIHLY